MVCCSKWWRTSQAPAAVGSPSSFDINTFHNCAPTKRYRRKQLESFKWLWVLAMCQREYFLEYDFWLWMFWEIFRRFFCKIFQRTVGPICEQFTKGVWEIAALAEGYVLLAIKWGSNVSAEKHPFYYCHLFRYIMRVFMHLLIIKALFVCKLLFDTLGHIVAKSVFASGSLFFWGRIFLILRRNFPNMEEDFPNIEEKFS